MARERLAEFAARLGPDGLAVGTAGNLSVRIGDRMLITPSGVRYSELTPAQICEISIAESHPVSRDASSETPMHLAIYRTSPAAAVVHTHSAEVVALSASNPELPAIHYAITQLGGPVPVTSYHRFGSDALARAVSAALTGRQAVILQNHGAVTTGSSLAEAYDRALLLEWLARVYRLARSLGQPQILSSAELADVSAHLRDIGYGAG
jgi:L-fuculose-phosphate aldolase